MMTLKESRKVAALWYAAGQHGPKPKPTLPWPLQLLLLAVVVHILAGCTTMHKSNETADGKAADRYACEQQAYQAANGNALMLSNGLYRDCMRARGYR